MDFDNVLRHFGDLSQLDPVLPLANKIMDIIKDNNSPSNPDFNINHYWKILKYILRAKNPRLYVQLTRQVVVKLGQHNWKQDTLKNLIFMLSTIVNLERYLYARFDIV